MKEVLLGALAMVLVVVMMTTIMTFFGVDPIYYTPYMYFLVAMTVLGLYLSPQPISMIG